MRWARRSAWLMGAATLVIAAAGLALMAWDWSTPVTERILRHPRFRRSICDRVRRRGCPADLAPPGGADIRPLWPELVPGSGPSGNSKLIRA
jgi:hypothetical protein